MLHIDRNTQRYLDELDRNFKSTPLMSVGIEQEIEKVFDDIDLDWNKHYSRVEKGLNSFENKLKVALSDPLPHYYVGKQRPRLRKLPFKNTGELANSVYATPTRTDGDNTMTITVNAGATSIHAEMTNAGWNSSKRDVHWLAWADTIFASSSELGRLRHSSKIPNIRDVLLGYYS